MNTNPNLDKMIEELSRIIELHRNNSIEEAALCIAISTAIGAVLAGESEKIVDVMVTFSESSILRLDSKYN